MDGRASSGELRTRCPQSRALPDGCAVELEDGLDAALEEFRPSGIRDYEVRLRMDEDRRNAAQGTPSWRVQSRMGGHLYVLRLQPRAHAEPAVLSSSLCISRGRSVPEPKKVSV